MAARLTTEAGWLLERESSVVSMKQRFDGRRRGISSFWWASALLIACTSRAPHEPIDNAPANADDGANAGDGNGVSTPMSDSSGETTPGSEANAATSPSPSPGSASEGNINPVGLQGSGPEAGSSGTGGNAGTVSPPACPIPAPSDLIGWAAVAGNGVMTTTGGGDLAPQVVTSLAQLQDAVKGDKIGRAHV